MGYHTTRSHRSAPGRKDGDVLRGRWEPGVWSGDTASFDLVVDATQVLATAFG